MSWILWTIAISGLVLLVVVIIIVRSGAVDRAKADAALQSAEAQAAAQASGFAAWVRAKFKKKDTP